MSVWAAILEGLTPAVRQGLQEGVDRHQLGALQSRYAGATTPEERAVVRAGFRPELLARFDANTKAENDRQIAALTLKKLGFDVDAAGHGATIAGSNARVATGTEGDRMQIPGLQRTGLETKNKADAIALKNAPLLQALQTEKTQSEIAKNKAAAAKSLQPGKASVYQFTTKDGKSGTVFADDRKGIGEIIKAGGRVFAGVASDTVSSFDPSKKTTQSAQEQLVNFDSISNRLSMLQEEFDPSRHTYWDQFQTWWTRQKEKSGGLLGDVSPEEQQQFKNTASYKQQTIAYLNESLNKTAGKAVSANELKRKLAEVPNMDDSSTEFKIKLDNTVRNIQEQIETQRNVLGGQLPLLEDEKELDLELDNWTPEQMQAFLAAS